MQRDEEGKLAEIQNRSFAGTWGYKSNTVEEVIYYTNVGDCSPEDVILAFDADLAGFAVPVGDSLGEHLRPQLLEHAAGLDHFSDSTDPRLALLLVLIEDADGGVVVGVLGDLPQAVSAGAEGSLEVFPGDADHQAAVGICYLVEFPHGGGDDATIL